MLLNTKVKRWDGACVYVRTPPCRPAPYSNACVLVS